MALRTTRHDRRRPDLVLESTHERIAELRHVARTARPVDGASDRGPMARARDAVGRRLIALGSALITDETIGRRPALHL